MRQWRGLCGSGVDYVGISIGLYLGRSGCARCACVHSDWRDVADKARREMLSEAADWEAVKASGDLDAIAAKLSGDMPWTMSVATDEGWEQMRMFCLSELRKVLCRRAVCRQTRSGVAEDYAHVWLVVKAAECDLKLKDVSELVEKFGWVGREAFVDGERADWGMDCGVIVALLNEDVAEAQVTFVQTRETMAAARARHGTNVRRLDTDRDRPRQGDQHAASRY